MGHREATTLVKVQDPGLMPPAEHLTPRKRIGTLVTLAGVVGLVVGSVVLLGWLLDVARLKGLLPGFALMQPNTALSLGSAGLSPSYSVEKCPDHGPAGSARAWQVWWP